MSRYAMIYIGGRNPGNPEESQEGMQEFNDWMKLNADAFIEMGNPVTTSKIVSTAGVSDAGDDDISGYSILEADSLEAAVEIVKDCPFLKVGKLQIGELMEM